MDKTQIKWIDKANLQKTGGSKAFIIPKHILEKLELENEIEYMIDYSKKHDQLFCAFWKPKKNKKEA